MISAEQLIYLQGYPGSLVNQLVDLANGPGFGAWLAQRYPQQHQIRNDKALYPYVQELKQRYLKKAPPLRSARFYDKLHLVKHALGTHTSRTKNHGGKAKASYEIRISGLFRQAPEPLLKMLVVHELAHFKEQQHNKAFYALCCHMLPDYHELELAARVYLSHIELQQGAEHG